MKDWGPWDAFLEEVERVKRTMDFRAEENCIYRGQNDSKKKLLPSLYRMTELDDDALWWLESDLFFEFQSRSQDVREYDNDWDILFHMRHYGVPTRLLDWTEVLGVALFFAVYGYDSKSGAEPCVWLLNPWSLNAKTWVGRDLVAPQYLGWDSKHWEYDQFGEMLVYKDEMPWDGPVAIFPRQNNPRMAAQRGLFTIHGNDRRPLEQQYPKWARRICLEPELISLVADLLEIFGVDQYLAFPDSENLAHALKQKYEVPGPSEFRIGGRTPVSRPASGRSRARERERPKREAGNRSKRKR